VAAVQLLKGPHDRMEHGCDACLYSLGQLVAPQGNGSDRYRAEHGPDTEQQARGRDAGDHVYDGPFAADRPALTLLFARALIGVWLHEPRNPASR